MAELEQTYLEEPNQEPRPIEVLTKLDTYQGMSDEEINMLINFKAQQQALDSVYLEQMEQFNAAMLIKAGMWADAATTAQTTLQTELEAAKIRLEHAKNGAV